MNIHLYESSILDNIHNCDDVLYHNTFGSNMYGTNSESSDEDVLFITKYIDIKDITNHQLQLKNFSNKDVIITPINQFLRNLMSGDSTINFELISDSNILLNDRLSFLYNYMHEFINYRLIKSYLGMCKRDIKYFNKSTNSVKKLTHIHRGILSARHLYEYKMGNIKNIDMESVYKSTCRFNNSIKNINNFDSLLNSFKIAEESLRIELNESLVKGVLKSETILSDNLNKHINECYKEEFNNIEIKKFITDKLIEFKDKDIVY